MKLVRSEDVDARLRALLEEAREVGREAEHVALRAGEEVRRSPHKPDLSEQLFEDFRATIYDEVVVAKPAQGETVIEQREEEREIAKRALAHVKLAKLREIAGDHGLVKTGTLDEVADRIVRAFKADEERIAELVIRYEDEPPPDRRFTTRVFRLRRGPNDIAGIAARAQLFTKRYIRTGIARWFLIEEVDSISTAIEMKGTFRYFSADAAERDGNYRLTSTPGIAEARLKTRRDDPSVEVHAKGPTESRALMSAFQQATKLDWRETLMLPDPPTDDELRAWDYRTVFMVALLQARFRSSALEIVNLTSAGFQTGTETGGEESRPAVRSVRFQGRHLLDSRSACELIVRGQGLVELGMMIRFKPNAEETFVVPLTIRLDRDHLAAMTGFGLYPPAAVRPLHDAVTTGTRYALQHGLDNDAEMRRLARDIRQRAEQEEPATRATLFGGPSAPDDDESE